MKILLSLIVASILLSFRTQEAESKPQEEAVQDRVETKEELNQSNNTETNEKSEAEIQAEEEELRNKEAELNFSYEWSSKMSDYEPKYVYMIPVDRRMSEVFYESILKVPVKVRGAYLISSESGSKKPIEIFIKGPSKQSIYKNATIAGIFEFEATEAGDYYIILRNRISKEPITVTFTMNTYQDEILTSEHLSFSEEKLNNLSKFMTTIYTEEGFSSQFMRDKRKCKFK